MTTEGVGMGLGYLRLTTEVSTGRTETCVHGASHTGEIAG